MYTTPEDEPLLFGDGVHPTMATKVSYGWIRTGEDKPIATKGSKTRMNLMGAINLETMHVILGSFETLDTEAITDCFEQLRVTYPQAPKIYLILDRGSYDTTHETRSTAKKKGIVLHFLPLNSPVLNPIERCCKVMKEYVRNSRFFHNAKEFREEIMHFFEDNWPKISMSMVDRINDHFHILKSPFSG